MTLWIVRMDIHDTEKYFLDAGSEFGMTDSKYSISGSYRTLFQS